MNTKGLHTRSFRMSLTAHRSATQCEPICPALTPMCFEMDQSHAACKCIHRRTLSSGSWARALEVAHITRIFHFSNRALRMLSFFHLSPFHMFHLDRLGFGSGSRHSRRMPHSPYTKQDMSALCAPPIHVETNGTSSLVRTTNDHRNNTFFV